MPRRSAFGPESRLYVVIAKERYDMNDLYDLSLAQRHLARLGQGPVAIYCEERATGQKRKTDLLLFPPGVTGPRVGKV